jgi:hypothetical protein
LCYSCKAGRDSISLHAGQLFFGFVWRNDIECEVFGLPNKTAVKAAHKHSDDMQMRTTSLIHIVFAYIASSSTFTGLIEGFRL